MTYMRLTTKLLNDNVVNNLYMNRAKLDDLNEQLATGKKITKPSEDPNSAINIMSAKTSNDQIERYMSNVDEANSELSMADQTITQTVDIIQRAKELATEASNATSGSTGLASINAEIEQLIQQVKSIANTKYGSKYIYGGQVTETPPYSQSTNGDIVYNGTPSDGNYQRKIEIGENITIDTNVAGDSIFGQYVAGDSTKQSGLIGTLTNLSNNLKAATPNYDDIRSNLDNLDKDLNNFLSVQATVGGTMSRLTMTKSKLEDDSLTFQKVRTDAEGVDLSKVISDISYQETTLQASLKVGAKITQYSIMDYM
jgi:flagellar hook-associated protein 3 FlgL